MTKELQDLSAGMEPTLASVRSDLSDELGMKADVVTFTSVHPLLRDEVLRDQVPLFG